ncbi:hypothetical protein [Streptococcus sp. NLN64]|uniref:hypothetical protein n=1 Tax=Streptococcus sp. NLN64 TaxID=2822799 RepID=UPI0018C99795|nr:hypothetical protein [Streptococcus sp. NLN64]MBG9366569.1 hypothetical protein [Streptococcus sp. NLN64]
MSLNTGKLTAFAQAVGVDYKELKQMLGDKVSTSDLNTAIEQAKTAVKSELLGEGVPEQFDTLKEIADAITNMSGGTEAGVVAKLAELGQKLDDIEALDLVSVYNQAKA